MQETLRQVVQYTFVGGVPRPERVDLRRPRLFLEDVLPPPEIELISLFDYEGQGDDFIGIDAKREINPDKWRLAFPNLAAYRDRLQTRPSVSRAFDEEFTLFKAAA